MKSFKKYYPFFIVLLISILNTGFSEPANYSWLGIVLVIISIILIFEYLEKTQSKRSKFWSWNFPGKFKHSFKFSIFYGAPISIILCFFIYNKAEPLDLFLFLIVPVMAVFGWVGFNDWIVLKKIMYENKSNVKL
ncbi:MAG: hypothetical protein JEY94_04830 [Melioribacteraceae bacterium]|nr:hypothetical protein [Melioribacteraceae bacterium]